MVHEAGLRQPGFVHRTRQSADEALSSELREPAEHQPAHRARQLSSLPKQSLAIQRG